ncbi:type II secretion system F family protein [Streptomyces sp. WMMC940]|uniref:type II secretion system F family protein n=1 Tax=Streptomyces sp. WMMC940 TaxID=3015153 RepID=UPI0022B6BB74|nr:type II secretion system F family protein [Streptomyces sp. WMMC940]MCZ7458217.1 type II secretion system F family protein [Streptomyces sp. WMMC940]
MSIPTVAILSGATIGGGLALLVRTLVRPQPDLAGTLEKLNQTGPLPGDQLVLSQDERWGSWLLPRLTRLPGVRIPRTDLALVGQPPAKFILTKAALAMTGFLLPAFFFTVWSLLGLTLAFVIPTAVCLGLALFLWYVPDLALRDTARRARDEFRHAIAAYLDLVALERAGDAGPTEALERAAAIGRGWAFRRLQDALQRARVDKVPPWDTLKTLSEELELPVLEDVADIMRLSAHDGAAVYATLRARAKSLRTELMSKDAEEANADSERMTAPGALLAVLMMLLIGFPAVIRIITG